MRVLGKVANHITPWWKSSLEIRVEWWTIFSFINPKGQMVLTNNQLHCQLHNPTLTEVIPIQILNPHPVAEATSVEREEATAVERDEAMVEEMAGARHKHCLTLMHMHLLSLGR